MNNDFRIDIAPNGAALRFNLYTYQGGAPDAGQSFDRQHFSLTDALIDKLRRGDASPAEVQQITADLSTWLFGIDISPSLQAVLNQPNGDPLRLIFSINDQELREKLADAPFELCKLPGGGIPLALNAKNASIFHLLPKVGTPPSASTAGGWPLRILIVRSNPLDLGGAIPPAAEVRKEIYQILDNKGFSHNLVQIHVLSSENAPDLAGRPTREGFRNQIEKAPYDILVYLGHGDVLPVYQGLPPVNVLQLESDDGNLHITVPSDQLAVLLHERSVPVVLLIGCLTAAGIPANQKAGVASLIPQWMRGVQGLAQALVNSEAGVQFAVGTRYMLETADAMRFLQGFFKSLLSSKPGNAEAAVHAARRDLHFGNPGSYSWSAPIVFRNLRDEPIFPFLASPPTNVCPTAEQHQSLRVIFWDNLSKQAWSLRAQGGAGDIHTILDQVEQQYVQTVTAGGQSLIMPKWVEGRSEEVLTIPVELHGALNIDKLRGTLVVGSDQVKVTSLQATAELQAQGYDVLSSTKKNQATFSLERNNGAGGLIAGPLFNATVQLDSANQVVYPISVNIIETSPNKPVCTGGNAVIIPPP